MDMVGNEMKPQETSKPVVTMNLPTSDLIMKLIHVAVRQADKWIDELLCREMCQWKDFENTDIEFDEPDHVADLDLNDWLYCIF